MFFRLRNPKGSRPASAARRSRRRGGYMLIEAALAIVIVGVAVVALLAVIHAGTKANAASRELTRATYLAQEIRELIAPLPSEEEGGGFGPEAGESLSTYDDIDDFQDVTFSPAINSQRQTLTDAHWDGWSQKVTVENVDPNYLAGHQTLPGGSTDMMRVTVEIYRDNRFVHRISWLAAAYAQEDAGG